MPKTEFNEQKVVAELREKADITIVGSMISQLFGSKAKGDVGIKSKGKLDFLTRYCGYNFQWVTDFK